MKIDALPEPLKTALSEVIDGDATVHYNSAHPPQLPVLGQDNGIHLAAEEGHPLPSEAWHVVQPAQGRVHPTRQTADVSCNDAAALEREAHRLGEQALKHAAGPLPGKTTA